MRLDKEIENELIKFAEWVEKLRAHFRRMGLAEMPIDVEMAVDSYTADETPEQAFSEMIE